MKRKVIIFVLILAILAIVYFLVIRISVNSEFSHDRIPNKLKFDKQTWVRGDMRQRGQMVNDLIISVGLVGKTKSEILGLLGSPDDTNNITKGEYKSSISYRVDLGHTYIYDLTIYCDSTGHSKYVKIDD